MWKGGIFSPLCPEQYLYADSPKGAQAMFNFERYY